ncbi:MAG: protein phosphatase 2C domain-containing protein, partial [Peptococcaceae bacterium]|nr:protein phosphatase 2C domain-containing protein [Peptococcaceae bacterium]
MPYCIILACLLVALLIIRTTLGKLEHQPALEIAHAQAIGRREINADVFDWSVSKGSTMLVLADGIGTGTRGRTAALAATGSVVRSFELNSLLANPAYFFRQAFRNANENVLRYIPDGTAGTNLLCALLAENKLYYALVGNCKASVFRNGILIPLSDGHTLDVLARKAFKRHEIRRADARMVYHDRRVCNYVGKDDLSEIELFDVPVQLKSGDYLVLMTDGVYDFCPQQDLENILKTGTSCSNKAQ